MTVVGAPIDRVDGPRKVCGRANYTGDLADRDATHAVLVTSTIARGRISAIDDARARVAPGVLLVMTHLNAMRVPAVGRADGAQAPNRVLTLLQDDRVHYQNEPVAVVVAETFTQAVAAAALLRIRYEADVPVVDFEAGRATAVKPGKIQDSDADSARGDFDAAWHAATHRIEHEYTTPYQNHNPMEPHATLARWDGDRLTLEDSTQFVAGVRRACAQVFSLAPEQIRVRSAFVGGAFGGKGSAWSHVMLAAMAARQVGRPVLLAMQRPQMFGPVGGRPRTAQPVRLAASDEGRLKAIEHRSFTSTSTIEDWTESCAMVTRSLYESEAVVTSHRLVRLDVGTPTFQRAPGECTGMFALESALDELAVELRMDPVALRALNASTRDADKNLPYSSTALRECYRVGADRFGWARRSPTPASMTDGRWQVGYGMASATRPAKRMPCAARARLQADGMAVVQSSTAELGTGSYTVMAQVAADALGWPVARVRFELGDTDLPEAPISAGSMTMESVGSAVHNACVAVRALLIEQARQDRDSPFAGLAAADVQVQDGWLRHARDPARRELVAAFISRHGGSPIEALGNSKPGPEAQQFSMHTFGALFVEARVDRDLGIVRVPRVVGAFGVGRVINAKTAHSQLMG
ncbi:MAG TPA: xanthine dehydrogenase family protein molybdopterin-binding subunit, partial [Burkholderiaceae bacterium]|nr:xanthine dehydrogenase family protein molybdopterin-binding subunit [Burkholderiaceae bacterium]